MASPFSTSGEDVLTRSLDVQAEKTPVPGIQEKEFEEYYELERTVREIEKGDHRRIALQFPDELLHDSVPVFRRIQARLNPEARRELYVLADTSYGSCCVDEVAASHVDADLLVHYGHACLSQTTRLPVIYIFGQKTDISIDHCVSRILEYIDRISNQLADIRSIVLRHAVAYNHIGDKIAETLRNNPDLKWPVRYDPLPARTEPASKLSPFVNPPSSNVSQANEATQAPSPHTVLENLGLTDTNETSCNSLTSNTPEQDLILWVGDESPTLTKILITSANRTIIAYSPSTDSVTTQSHLTNRLLMRRYALIQRARDADVFGMLIGTLGVANYLPLLSQLRTVLKSAHKKSYTVSVGKINPSKLANFMEIECWVWVSCSEGMIDSKEFLRPIISPYELELALQAEPQWTGKYVSDFNELLTDAWRDGAHKESTNIDAKDDNEDEDDEKPMFSLVTGKYRHARRYGVENTRDVETEETHDGGGAVILRNRDTALSKRDDRAAASFLQSRTYQGLDPRLGQDEPGVLEQGRAGIARGYADDHLEE